MDHTNLGLEAQRHSLSLSAVICAACPVELFPADCRPKCIARPEGCPIGDIQKKLKAGEKAAHPFHGHPGAKFAPVYLELSHLDSLRQGRENKPGKN